MPGKLSAAQAYAAKKKAAMERAAKLKAEREAKRGGGQHQTQDPAYLSSRQQQKQQKQQQYAHPTQDPSFFSSSSSKSSRTRSGLKGPPKNHASRSHELSKEYEESFIRSYEGLALENKSSLSSSSSGGGLRRQRGPTGGVSEQLLMDSVSVDHIEELPEQWREGPLEAKGTLLDFCDRPILCSSLLDDECVVGSSDHSLYCFDVNSGKRTRELFSKAAGHREWVTCVAHAGESGHVVSGCAEGKICLWAPRSRDAVEITGHTSSISTLLINDRASLVCSGSYDGTVRFWNGRGQELARLQAHEGGVLGCAWLDQTLVSGGRDGCARVWDMHTGKLRSNLKGHKGHITAVVPLFGGDLPAQSCIFATGAQGGCVRVWDTRAKSAVAAIAAHHHASKGSGAVGGIVHAPSARAVVTYGADKRICVLDPRAGFKVVRAMSEQREFIYAMRVAGDQVFSGAGDGALLAHDIKSGSVLWGLGANRAAIRAIEVTPTRLVCAGDDGNAILYDFF
jgi:WD40 repeat protein